MLLFVCVTLCPIPYPLAPIFSFAILPVLLLIVHLVIFCPTKSSSHDVLPHVAVASSSLLVIRCRKHRDKRNSQQIVEIYTRTSSVESRCGVIILSVDLFWEDRRLGDNLRNTCNKQQCTRLFLSAWSNSHEWNIGFWWYNMFNNVRLPARME